MTPPVAAEPHDKAQGPSRTCNESKEEEEAAAEEPHDVLAAGWDIYRACPNIDAAFDPADPGGSARRILPLILPNCSAESVDVEQVFKLPWREAGPPNYHYDKVGSDQ